MRESATDHHSTWQAGNAAKIRAVKPSEAATKVSTTAPRRSSATVRAALLQAAADMFANRGYGGASTRDIAAAAQVSEASIYRQFGSKAELFDAAVVAPFFESLSDFEQFFERAVKEEGWTDEDLIRESVTRLFAHLARNQNAMRALMTAHGDPDSEVASREAMRRIDDFFHRLNEMGRQRALRSDDFDASKLYLTQRFMTGLIFDTTALSAWFLPHGWQRPNEDELIEEITRFVLYGFIGRPRRS